MKWAYKKNAWPPVLHEVDTGRILLTGPRAVKRGWRRRPAFLDAGPSSTTLFAGPWLGEFGWELMNWQGLIRALSPHYEQVIVCSRGSSRDLYADCSHEYISHTIPCRPNCHAGLCLESPETLAEILSRIPADADHLIPLSFIPAQRQKFIQYGQRDPALKLDILIHARDMPSERGRNWSVSKWHEFLSGASARSWTVGAVGLSHSTLDLPGVVDCRDGDLLTTMNRMASSRLVVGPSSGPMHLASLCGAPHLVWTDQRTYTMKKTSREKYESWWNPLQTPVTVLDDCNFNPTVEQVLLEAEKLLGVG